MPRMNRLKERLRKERQRSHVPSPDPTAPALDQAAQNQAAQNRAALGALLEGTRRYMEFLKPPRVHSGSVHRAVAHPDFVKFDYHTFVESNRTWGRALRQFTRQYSTGKLSCLENIDDWAIEKFLWRGNPDLDTHPLDDFLRRAGNRYSPAAREQLCRWKEARLGLFEVGRVGEETVRLRAWNVERRAAAGEWFDAIDLSLVGVDNYRDRRGSVLFTYLAPWSPDDGLFCSLGYSLLSSKDDCPSLALHLNLNHADFGQRPWPWDESASERQRYRDAWTNREWLPWLRERITGPFPALIATSNGPLLARALQVFDRLSLRETVEFGNYLVVNWRGQEVLMGMTGVVPLDLTSPAAAALAEYSEYRKIVGPPPKAHLINELLQGK